MKLWEYSGKVYRKRKQDVVNKLYFSKSRIKPSQIKKITFNKRPTKYGWKYKAIIKRKT